VSLHPAAVADLTLPLVEPREPGGPDDTAVHRAILTALDGGGAYFLGGLVAHVTRLVAEADAPMPGSRPTATPPVVTAALWDLVWAGLVTNDGLAPLRARLGAGRTAHRARPTQPRSHALARGPRLGLRGGLARPGRQVATVIGQEAGGRWSLLPARELDPTLRAHALAAQLLDRHGVLTRAVAPAEGIAGQFGAVYRVLAALEQAGQVRRGYFVEHLGGSQFALPGAVDRLRADARTVDRALARTADHDAGTHPGRPDEPSFVVALAATDPANPYGAALGWPSPAGAAAATTSTGLHRPGRKAGAVVVLVDGALVLYVERGSHTVLTFTADDALLVPAAARLAEAIRAGRLGRVVLARADGAELLTGDALRGPLGRALAAAGFAPTPRGLRLRGEP
jgi:ATP-dependent Lhr-like helicase